MVYDEYDELASAERIIIEPQTGLNRDSSGSNDSNGPNGPIGSQDKTTKSTALAKDNDINSQDDESSKSVSYSQIYCQTRFILNGWKCNISEIGMIIKLIFL